MNKNIEKKLVTNIVIIAILLLCLTISSFAFVYTAVTIDDNQFNTGSVKINLNDGAPVVNDADLYIAPGMTIEREFFIKNQSSCDVWFKLYFENVSGALADVITVSIKDGDTVLVSDVLSHMTSENMEAIDMLDIDETKNLTICFKLSNMAGNDMMGQSIDFDFSASAVQVRNNPSKKFA